MDLFKEIFQFFANKQYSIASKFIGIIIVLLSLFFIDNILGFSFYYSNNQRITQIKNLQDLKIECKDNPKLLSTIIDDIHEIVKQKNVIKNFLELFSRENIDNKDKTLPMHIDTVYIHIRDTVFVEKHYIHPEGLSKEKEKSPVKKQN